MALTLAQAATAAAKLHTAAETAFTRDGRFTGTVALIQPDVRVSAVLPFGPDNAPPSDGFIAKAAAQRAAAGLAITGHYRLDTTPLTRRQAALHPADLPSPSDAHGAQSGEEIITTVVVRGHNQAIRYRTPIHRTAFGFNLGERTETRDEPVMAEGHARRLLALLETSDSAR